jgi:hypothetical protein
MPLTTFHPAVRRWFEQRLGEPTRAQALGWEAIRSGRHTLIAAPTGSGKTLAAFLNALDELLREGIAGGLPNETRIVYVSPLKALSSDIHKNLAEPRREIRQLAERMGLDPVKITAAVRTGDTPASERAAMLKSPPHILVTTPESLYLLLTARRSREMLRTSAPGAALTWRSPWSGSSTWRVGRSPASDCPPRSGRSARLRDSWWGPSGWTRRVCRIASWWTRVTGARSTSRSRSRRHRSRR